MSEFILQLPNSSKEQNAAAAAPGGCCLGLGGSTEEQGEL